MMQDSIPRNCFQQPVLVDYHDDRRLIVPVAIDANDLSDFHGVTLIERTLDLNFHRDAGELDKLELNLLNFHSILNESFDDDDGDAADDDAHQFDLIVSNVLSTFHLMLVLYLVIWSNYYCYWKLLYPTLKQFVAGVRSAAEVNAQLLVLLSLFHCLYHYLNL